MNIYDDNDSITLVKKKFLEKKKKKRSTVAPSPRLGLILCLLPDSRKLSKGLETENLNAVAPGTRNL